MRVITEESLIKTNRKPQRRLWEVITGRQIFISPIIASHTVRYAVFEFGLNCIYQELTEPAHIKIPIPFLKRDIRFIRYKKILLSSHKCAIEIRLDSKIKALEQLTCLTKLGREMRDSYVRVLKQIRGDIQ